MQSDQSQRTSTYTGEMMSAGTRKCVRIKKKIAICLEAVKIAKWADVFRSHFKILPFAGTYLMCFRLCEIWNHLKKPRANRATVTHAHTHTATLLQLCILGTSKAANVVTKSREVKGQCGAPRWSLLLASNINLFRISPVTDWWDLTKSGPSVVIVQKVRYQWWRTGSNHSWSRKARESHLITLDLRNWPYKEPEDLRRYPGTSELHLPGDTECMIHSSPLEPHRQLRSSQQNVQQIKAQARKKKLHVIFLLQKFKFFVWFDGQTRSHWGRLWSDPVSLTWFDPVWTSQSDRALQSAQKAKKKKKETSTTK